MALVILRNPLACEITEDLDVVINAYKAESDKLMPFEYLDVTMTDEKVTIERFGCKNIAIKYGVATTLQSIAESIKAKKLVKVASVSLRQANALLEAENVRIAAILKQKGIEP